MHYGMLEIGKITSVHGVKGLVKIYPNLQDYALFQTFGRFFLRDGAEIKITQKFVVKKNIVCELEGVATREAAESMVGTKIYVEKDALPELKEDEIYFDDLIGLKVENAKGQEFGEVIGTYNFGAGDILEIKLNSSGKDEMFSYDDSFELKGDLLIFTEN